MISEVIVQRHAKLNEITILNKLITDSRRHIGYDENNNNFFLKHFGLTEDYLNNQFVFVYEKNKKIVAMFGMSFLDKLKLDYFFITPAFIKKGLGRKMWQDVCSFVKQNKWSKFEFISNPHSVPFYCHMGAEVIADYGSLKEGMKIMSYYL